MQRLDRMPRASAYSPVFLFLFCIYFFRLFDAGCLKSNYPGQLLRESRYVHGFWPPGMSYNLRVWVMTF